MATLIAIMIGVVSAIVAAIVIGLLPLLQRVRRAHLRILRVAILAAIEQGELPDEPGSRLLAEVAGDVADSIGEHSALSVLIALRWAKRTFPNLPAGHLECPAGATRVQQREFECLHQLLVREAVMSFLTCSWSGLVLGAIAVPVVGLYIVRLRAWRPIRDPLDASEFVFGATMAPRSGLLMVA